MAALHRILWLLFLWVVFSCNMIKGDSNKSKFETFLTAFINEHPDFNQNDVIRKETGKALQDAFYKKIETGIFSDHPLRLSAVNEQEDGYYAQFKPDYKSQNIKGDINFDIVTKITEDQVRELKEGNLYYLEGENPIDISRQLKKYINSAYTPMFQIRGNKDYPEIDLGVTLIKATSIKPVHK